MKLALILILLAIPSATAQTVVWAYCEGGICWLTEPHLDALHELAKKAGKGCV